MTEAVSAPLRLAWTEAEAAASLGMSERELRGLRLAGIVPVMDLGRIDGVRVKLVRYSVVALTRWAADVSGYAAPQEGGDGEEASTDAVRAGQRLSAVRRDMGRGRPARGAAAKAPVRLVRG